MRTLDQIRRALEQLPIWDRRSIEFWLQEMNDREAGSSRIEEAHPAQGALDAPLMTLEEFFEFEERSPERHEYINGMVYAMSGASVAHAGIVDNLVLAFGNHLRGGPCRAFSSALKLVIRCEGNDISYYPDVIVDCRPDTRGAHFVQSPKLIVEVLSPSTRLIDRREKLQSYRLIDSLEEYVLAAQDERRVTIHRRADGWQGSTCAGIEAIAEFRSIGLSVPLTELYDRVLEDRGATPA